MIYPEVVQSKLWIFADDTKIYYTISSNEDSILLQNDLSSIMKWCSTWLMDLNYDKCKFLMSTEEEDISVMRVCEQSDLGVLFTSDFKFGPHIHNIVQKLYYSHNILFAIIITEPLPKFAIMLVCVMMNLAFTITSLISEGSQLVTILMTSTIATS